MTKRVLIIGAGGVGRRHIRGFLETERAALSVIEPDDEKRRQVLVDYDVRDAGHDLGETDLGAFDLSVIAAPAHVHVPLAQACADAGLPFLVEKPLSVSMQGVDELIDTVSGRGIVARVGFVHRLAHPLIEMRKQVGEGRIGELRMCTINASQDYPRYRPDYREIYYAREETGGGTILDGAIHWIDVLLWFFGPASEISAMYDRLHLSGVECEDSCLISVRFQNGGMAQIVINQFQKPMICTAEMIGTEGNLLLDMSKLKHAADDSGEWESRSYMEGMTPHEAHQARFRLQADAFMDIVEGKPGHLATLEEGQESLRIALAAKESYRTKRIIEL